MLPEPVSLRLPGLSFIQCRYDGRSPAGHRTWCHSGRAGDAFDPLRIGLDHIAFEVADRAELTSWMAHLDELGVGHSPVQELGHSFFVSLEDPDGNAV